MSSDFSLQRPTLLLELRYSDGENSVAFLDIYLIHTSRKQKLTTLDLPPRLSAFLRQLLKIRTADGELGVDESARGWRSRRKLAQLLFVSEETISQYASQITSLLAATRQALPKGDDIEVVERRRRLGMRLSPLVDLQIMDDSGPDGEER